MPDTTTNPRTAAGQVPVTSANGWNRLLRSMGRTAPALLTHNREVRRGFYVLIRKGS